MAPSVPDAESRAHLLAELADLIARAGAQRFLAEPVAPTPAAFPEPWERTPDGVRRLVRRLAWHAGIERRIEVQDCRWGAPPTERKPATAVEAVRATRSEATFAVGFIGEDDVAGTLAHEVGVLFAMLHRRDTAEPYRAPASPELAVDQDRDLERGSIAAVVLGLGVLAANAAYQQYTGSGRFNGGYMPLEYDVLRAGHLPMSDLAFLLAAQAVARGVTTPPAGLSPPQRDEVAAWIPHLERWPLRRQLGIESDAAGAQRPEVVPFASRGRRTTSGRSRSVTESGSWSTEPDPAAASSGTIATPAAPRVERASNAFRYRSHRGGIGLVTGTMIGVGVTFAIATRVPLFVLGGAGGHVVGRRIRVSRCTACVSIVPDGSPCCRACGARIRGEINEPADRLDAEEQLDAEAPDHDATPTPDHDSST